MWVFLYRGIDGECNGEWADVAEVEIRREAGGAVRLRMIALDFVVLEHKGSEEFEAFERGVGTTLPGIDRQDGAIEMLPAQGDVLMNGVGVKISRALPGMLRMCVFAGVKEVRQEPVEAGAKCVGAVLRFFDELGWNDDIAVDGPERDADASGKVFAPALRLAHRVLIADEESGVGVSEKLLVGFVRSAAQDEGDVARGEVCFDIGQTLIEESVVTKVGVRKVGDGGKVNHQRQPKQVCRLRRDIYGVIVDAALRALHPVDDTLALRVGDAFTPYGYARIGC